MSAKCRRVRPDGLADPEEAPTACSREWSSRQVGQDGKWRKPMPGASRLLIRTEPLMHAAGGKAASGERPVDHSPPGRQDGSAPLRGHAKGLQCFPSQRGNRLGRSKSRHIVRVSSGSSASRLCTGTKALGLDDTNRAGGSKTHFATKPEMTKTAIPGSLPEARIVARHCPRLRVMVALAFKGRAAFLMTFQIFMRSLHRAAEAAELECRQVEAGESLRGRSISRSERSDDDMAPGNHPPRLDAGLRVSYIRSLAAQTYWCGRLWVRRIPHRSISRAGTDGPAANSLEESPRRFQPLTE
jgi:hypothetical protein